MSPVSGLPLDAIGELCRRLSVARLWLFGSAATGGFDSSRSDFDFLVEFGPLAPGRRADAYFELREGLERLTGRKVDLVPMRGVENRFVRESIEATKVLIHAAA